MIWFVWNVCWCCFLLSWNDLLFVMLKDHLLFDWWEAVIGTSCILIGVSQKIHTSVRKVFDTIYQDIPIVLPWQNFPRKSSMESFPSSSVCFSRFSATVQLAFTFCFSCWVADFSSWHFSVDSPFVWSLVVLQVACSRSDVHLMHLTMYPSFLNRFLHRHHSVSSPFHPVLARLSSIRNPSPPRQLAMWRRSRLR